MSIAVHGALRVSELTYLTFDDICKEGGNFKISIPKSKTDQSGVGFEFIITPSFNENVCPCMLIQNDMDLFDEKTGRFFRFSIS